MVQITARHNQKSMPNKDEENPESIAEIGTGVFEEGMAPGSALAHLYRGEIHRMTLWRERLDRTTNWGVIAIAAILTWVFSSEMNPHYLILIGMVMLGVFLSIEAHRYRGYDIWRSRVRLMQENVFSYALDKSLGLKDPDWAEKLGSDYREPAMKLTLEEAIAHRLRRVYLPLFMVLLLAWVVRITAFADESWIDAAAVGRVPGYLIMGLVAISYTGLIVIAYRPRSWRAKGELRKRDLREK